MNGGTINNLSSLFKKLTSINTFVFDVDGVLTDGSVLVTEEGLLLRQMSTRDGQGIKTALDFGYNIGIITKGTSKGVRKRFEVLGVENIYDKVEDKLVALNDLTFKLNIDKNQILYMGDDLPDLIVMDHVGVFSCPSDASIDVLNKAEFISSYKGGMGCVREIIEKVMRLQGKWPQF